MRVSLSDLQLNITPDVYNGLVNLGNILSNMNPTEDLEILMKEKKMIKEYAKYKGHIMTRGVARSKLYWESYYMIVSGSYIYFYTNKHDFVPQLYLVI